MNISKVVTYFGCLIVSVWLISLMLIAQPSVDAFESADTPPPSSSEFPEFKNPGIGQHKPPTEDVELRAVLDEYSYIRGLGPDAVLAFTEQISEKAMAILESDINSILSIDSGNATDSIGGIEAEAWVGINNSGCVYSSLQSAVDDASPGDSLQLLTGLFNTSVDVSQSLSIQGGYNADCITHGGGTTRLNGDGSDSVVDIYDGTVILRYLEIVDGGGYGGGVDLWSDSQVTLEHTKIHSNNGTAGGGVYVGADASITATLDSDISLNTASMYGGGVMVYGTFNGVDNASDIYQNSAPNGGGMYASNGATISLVGSDMYQNEATAATGKGGAIYAKQNSSIYLRNSSFIYYLNTAFDGGGIYADSSTITAITTAYFRENIADHYGGSMYLTNNSTFTGPAFIGQLGASPASEAVRGAGIYAVTSTVQLEGVVVNNIADDQGAGIYADASVLNLTDVQIGGVGDYEPNSLTMAEGFGAGMYLTGGTQATLLRTDIISNHMQNPATVAFGLGIYIEAGSALTMTDSSIEYHTALGSLAGRGAGLYANNSTVTMGNCSVMTNTSSHEGGGIRIFNGGTLSMDNSQFRNNQSTMSSGGALAVASNNPGIILNSIDFQDNDADANGGAIYMTSGSLDINGGWNIRQNSAGGNGGGIAIADASTVSIAANAYSLVYANQADGMGGFLYTDDNDATIDFRAPDVSSTYVYANHADMGGGAIALVNGSLVNLYGQINFDRNWSYGANGGAIHLTGGSDLQCIPVDGDGQVWWDNRADNGGAIYADSGADINCTQATFGANSDPNQAQDGSGGSLYLVDSTFTATNSAFNISTATVHGGAVAAYTSTVTIDADFATCDPAVTECSVFDANMADSDADNIGFGGGLYARESTVNVSYTIFHDNIAYKGGGFFQTGAAADAQIRNTLMYSNSVSSAFGAGIRSEEGTVLLRHITLANNINAAGYSQSNTSATINQSISWGNTLGGFRFYSGTKTGVCNIDQSEEIGIDVDPLYIDALAGDFRLDKLSPAVDACTSGLADDFDGTSRPQGPKYDMGAYEISGQFEVYMPVTLNDS